MIKKEKLPPIPATEWIALTIGIILFVAIESVLFLKGYTNILLNSVVALIGASTISYGAFGVKNKIKRILSGIKRFVSVILAIPLWLIKEILDVLDRFVSVILAIPKALVRAILYILNSIPSIIIKIISSTVKVIKALPNIIKTLLKFFGIALLNLAMIPVLIVYLTIYGMIFSLSGGTSKIMLKHYDALGHTMIAPIEKYLYLEAIVVLVTIGVIVAVGALILNGLQTSSSITASDAAYAASGNGLTAMSTFTSYLPVLAIVIIIGIIIILFRSFSAGAGAFSAGL